MNITLAGAAAAYSPTDTELKAVSLEFAAFDGEVGTGQLPIPDSAAALSVASGRQAMVEQGTTLLTDGFIIDQSRARGPEARGTAREHTFSVMDANALLDGFRVQRSRPAETDYARVMAFAALDGPSWDTTWVLNSSTVTLPAKKYRTDGWSDLIFDLVEFTGKTLFLHDKAGGGRCLHYHVLTTGHTSGLTISDVATAINQTTIWAPWDPERRRTSVDLRNDVLARDQAGRTSLATDATSIAAHDADGLQHQALLELEATSQADLDVKTAAFLASQKNERDTFTCSIGPLDEDALALIRVGDLIPVTSSVMGLTASTQRIAHMTLTPVTGWQWLARLELGAPVRRRARVRNRTTVTPTPPFSPTPCESAWDSFDDRDTLIESEDWGSTSADSIPWLVRNVNTGGALSSHSNGWVSGGFGFLQTTFVISAGFPCAYVTSGTPVSTTDWEALFRFRIKAAIPDGELDVAQIAVIHREPATGNFHTFANVRALDATPVAGDIAADTWYMCRFGRESAGPTYRWRVWPDGTGEPATWDDSEVDATAVEVFGFVLVALADVSPPDLPAAEFHIDWLDFGDGCDPPAEASPGQDVSQSLGISDGTTTAYRTRDPYIAGSLAVYADDIREWHITETDPATGEWEFEDAPFTGETVRVEYRVA